MFVNLPPRIINLLPSFTSSPHPDWLNSPPTLNRYTTGYEKQVGKKTTVRVLNNALGKALIEKFNEWNEAMRDQVKSKDEIKGE